MGKIKCIRIYCSLPPSLSLYELVCVCHALSHHFSLSLTLPLSHILCVCVFVCTSLPDIIDWSSSGMASATMDSPLPLVYWVSVTMIVLSCLIICWLGGFISSKQIVLGNCHLDNFWEMFDEKHCSPWTTYVSVRCWRLEQVKICFRFWSTFRQADR